MNMKSFKREKAIAEEHRLANADNPAIDYSKGFVLVYGNEVCGWSGYEPFAKSWKPGTVAVHYNGLVMIATGGNDYDGAAEWEWPSQPIPTLSDREIEELESEAFAYSFGKRQKS
ncbi:hypothetical protein [Oceanobacter mangrovi]|uniref:hypothetical protein n=1 Tax=Oceanobacter mangrovi TaxID=2862510 RepID=UPI001C8DA965|nr:hypothetical protein [Oceanobacter mangrovi]